MDRHQADSLQGSKKELKYVANTQLEELESLGLHPFYMPKSRGAVPPPHSNCFYSSPEKPVLMELSALASWVGTCSSTGKVQILCISGVEASACKERLTAV